MLLSLLDEGHPTAGERKELQAFEDMKKAQNRTDPSLYKPCTERVWAGQCVYPGPKWNVTKAPSRLCSMCAVPLRTYLNDYPDNHSYVFRTDCGQHALYGDLTVPLVSYNQPPAPNFLPPKYASPNSWTNAWCATASQMGAAHAEASHDYFVYPASWVNYPGYSYDYYYCKANGYLEPSVVAMKKNYSAIYDYALAKCATLNKTRDLNTMTYNDMLKDFRPYDWGAPSDEMAETVAAWSCASGGPGGDISYCAHTYYDLTNEPAADWPSTKYGWTTPDGLVTEKWIKVRGNATSPPAYCMYPDWYGETNPGFSDTEFEHLWTSKLWKCPPKFSYPDVRLGAARNELRE